MGAAEGAWREWRPKIVEEPPLEAPPWLSFAWTDAAKRRRDCTSLQTVKKAHLEARVWSDVEEMEDLRRLLREHRRELVEQLEQLKGRREALAGYMAARRAAQDEARAAKAAAREVRQHAKAAKGAAKAAAKAAKEAAQTNADEAISGLATATGVSHERAVQVIQGASAAQRVRPVKDAEPQVAVPAFAAFQEHAPGAMASLFRNDFLVGSGRGKQRAWGTRRGSAGSVAASAPVHQQARVGKQGGGGRAREAREDGRSHVQLQALLRRAAFLLRVRPALKGCEMPLHFTPLFEKRLELAHQGRYRGSSFAQLERASRRF